MTGGSTVNAVLEEVEAVVDVIDSSSLVSCGDERTSELGDGNNFTSPPPASYVDETVGGATEAGELE